jgi:recombination protein RecA
VRCSDRPQPPSKTNKRRWARLDQALRATDLLLQAGGFAAIVLDLGDMAKEYACRIPLATWFRFRQAAEHTRCSLIVLGQAGYAQSSAAVTLGCEALQPETAGSTVLRGFTFKLQRGRQRFSAVRPGIRKPPVSTWSAGSAWDTSGGQGTEVPQVSISGSSATGLRRWGGLGPGRDGA